MIVSIPTTLTVIDGKAKKNDIQSMNMINSKKAIKERSNTNIRHGRHCRFLLHAHLVFVTKYRKVCFTSRVLEHLEDIFKSVCHDFESELVEFEGEGDHVHLLDNFPPKVSISKLVGSLKEVSSRYIREAKYPEIKNKLWGKALWSPSYFASSCGCAPLEIIKQYIEQQERPH